MFICKAVERGDAVASLSETNADRWAYRQVGLPKYQQVSTLDTNICIYAIKHKPEQVFMRLQEHDPIDICISSVTYAELVHGVEKSKAIEKNRVALALLLANIEIMNFDSLAAESYGKIRADLEKAGTPIGPLDMMIAGHAKALGYTVVTNNTKEFARVKGLKLENWSE